MNKKYILTIISLFAAVCLVFGACSGSEQNPSENNSEDGSVSTDAENGISDESDSSDADAGSDEVTSSDDSTESDDSTVSEDVELINQIYGENPSYPYITLESEKKSVSAGSNVKVSLKLNNAENVACFNMSINFDSSVLSLSEYETVSASGFICEAADYDGIILLAGYTAKTVDFDGEDIVTLYFTVNSNVSADSTVISASASGLLIGTDDSGEVIADLTDVQPVECECVIAITE